MLETRELALRKAIEINLHNPRAPLISEILDDAQKIYDWLMKKDETDEKGPLSFR